MEVGNNKAIHLNLARYKPIRGGNSFADTHAGLRDKKAIVNVQNKDNLCFLYSILAQLHPAEINANRVNNYKKYHNTLKYDSIEILMSVGDIDRFEKLNQDLTINVYAYEEGVVFPRRMSERRGEKSMNLIMYANLKEGYYYALIKNFDRHLGSCKEHQRRFCPY